MSDTKIRTSRKLTSLNGDDLTIWDSLKAGHGGAPMELSNNSELHIQVYGSFNGAVVAIEGSNVAGPDDLIWTGIVDGHNLPLEFSEGDPIKQAGAIPRWVAPRVIGGDESTDLNVNIIIRESSR